jgi:hypothetical protein
VKKITCSICGVWLRDGKWIQSKFTGAYFCPRDCVQGCEDRSLAK